jgi:hypothetical protein
MYSVGVGDGVGVATALPVKGGAAAASVRNGNASPKASPFRIGRGLGIEQERSAHSSIRWRSSMVILEGPDSISVIPL